MQPDHCRVPRLTGTKFNWDIQSRNLTANFGEFLYMFHNLASGYRSMAVKNKYQI